MKKEDLVGIASSTVESSQNYADNVVLGSNRGHGFAGEKANHLQDIISGKDATIVGGDNAKNGADRLVDGVYIQTKYCQTGSKCIAECFEGNSFKYWNGDGTPMQIEVPSDKYDSAVQAMEHRIKTGQVQDITDPQMAKQIVKKGAFTYEQVKNIAKFGTIESLTYDAVNGIKLAGTAMGISAVISFAMAMWNGKDFDQALTGSCHTGLKVGGIAWVSSIITAQIGRTGVERGLRGTTDWVVKQMGAKTSAWLANGLRSGNGIYGAAAMNNVSKLLRGNLVAGVATTLVMSSVDFVHLFQGQISASQVFKNLTTNASGVAGGTGGWMVGMASGATIGSLIPVIGTTVGGVIGGFIGAFSVGVATSQATSLVLDQFIEDDAEAMLKIGEEVFAQISSDYLLNQQEAEKVITELKRLDLSTILRQMYASNNRRRFAYQNLELIVIKVIKNRKVISLPTNEQIFTKTTKVIEALATA